MGQAVSELALRGLRDDGPAHAPIDVSYSPFPVIVGDAGTVVTDDVVAGLRDG